MKGKRIIRTLTEGDWEKFKVLDQSAFPEDCITREQFFSRIEKDENFGLFIEEDLEGILFVTRFGEKGGYIQKIAVSSLYQGKGYGSMLMDHAIEWFREQGGIKTVQLFTQQDNHVAQGLYKKYGFAVTGSTWHYFVPRDSLRPTGFYKCQEIKEDEIDEVGNKYEAFPAAQIKRFLENERYHVMTLKDKESQIIGVCRFTPGFPGCFPFVMDIPEAFDDFLAGLEPYSLPEFDYVRVTYTDMPKVAKLCEERGYKLHHKLFKMSLEL